MEELKEFCEAGMPITLSSSWEEFHTAMQLLTSQGYIEITDAAAEEEAEEDSILFVKQEIVNQDVSFSPWDEEDRSPFTFPSKAPQLECAKPRAERSNVDSEWKACPSFQLDTSKLPSDEQVRIKAEIPKLCVNTQQKVGMKVLVQPFAKIDEAQLYIKLCIETLIVGVSKAEFLTDNFSLGYYPYFIRLTLEPELAGSSDLVAIPIYTKQGSQDQIDPVPSAIIKQTSGTTVNAQLGFGPAVVSLQHSRGMEWESSRNKQLISFDAVDADGNAASFEWSILRWKNEARYVAERPLRSILARPPKLPFPGTAPKLDAFPDIVWRFKRGVKDQPLTFLLCLDVQMHLVWLAGSGVFFKSPGVKPAGFQFKNQFVLELPRSIQDSISPPAGYTVFVKP